MEFQFIGPDDVPEEVKQQMEQMLDRQKMGMQSVAHDVQRLFRELNEDQLGTLRFLVHTIAHNPEAGFYYEGILSVLYSMKANVCPACGEDHDKQMAEAMEQDGTPPADGLRADVPANDPSTWSRVERSIRQANGGEMPADVGAAINRVMTEYNMRPANEDQDGAEQGAVCLGCGTRYVSLEDRLVKAKDDCSGCIQKAKWG